MKPKPIERRRVKVLRRHNGEVVLAHHKPEGGTEIMIGRELGDGEPAPLGARGVLTITKEADGCTYAEGVELRGPSKAATAAYRKNHAAIFGPTKLERALMN